MTTQSKSLQSELESLVERMHFYEQHPGSDGYDVTLDEFKRANRAYPISLAIAIQAYLRRPESHAFREPVDPDAPSAFDGVDDLDDQAELESEIWMGLADGMTDEQRAAHGIDRDGRPLPQRKDG